MSRFHRSFILFFALELLLVFFVSQQLLSFYWLFFTAFSYFLILFAMSMIPGMNFFVAGIHRLGSEKVMLTFDDGPHPELTPKTLDVLKEKGVKAQFFLIGKQVEEHPGIVKRIIDEGHAVGGHSYAHEPWFGFKFGKALTRDVMRAQHQLSDIKGAEVLFFRPPFGITNPNIAKLVLQKGLKVIGWSLRTYDTAYSFDQLRIQKVISKTKAGDIILMHERMQHTCDALPQLIDGIRKRGMEFGLLAKE